MVKIKYEIYEQRKEKTFEFIKQYIEQNGYAPTYREIAEGTGICINTVYHHLNQLRYEKRIDYIDTKARTIKIK